MYRLIIAMLGSALCGALLTYFVVAPDGEPTASEPVRDIVVVEKMSEAIAEEHRQDGYEALQTVEEIHALPSAFARAEALYALAGRSGSGAVQNLVFEANRIANDEDRSGALNILFFRLSELDPQSALALSRTDSLRGDRNQERRVWVSWARRDLDAALAAAKAETTKTAREFAAQSMFFAYGYMGNETTDRIEEEMGIGPDRNSRGRFIYRLADESPAKAIAFVNQMRPGTKQEEMVSWLAYYLAPRDPERALSYAVLFDNPLYIDSYKQIVSGQAASADPTEIMDRLVAGDRSGLTRNEIYGALGGVAKGDLDAAMAYYEQLRSAEEKQFLASRIVHTVASRDIDEALLWARSSDTGSQPVLEMQVLHFLAQRDLARAIQEANSMADPGNRESALAEVIQVAAQRNPAEAVRNMHLIENPNMRDDAVNQAISSWLRRDSNAAVNWLLAQDPETAREYLGSPRMILHFDVDAAIRLLDVVEESNQRSWRQQIANRIAQSRSAADAMVFVRQFEGEEGYGSLQTAVIAGVAQNDIYAARQMTEQLPMGEARDTAFAKLIETRATTHPQEALSWMGLIAGETQKGRAAASVASQWHARDPTAATNWARDLPAGVVRDDAISSIVNSSRDFGPEKEALIASISDDGKRSQAMLRYIYSTARRNPARAREFMSTAELADHDRQRAEQYLRRLEGGSY